jgi:hypothetical protein
MGTSGRSVSHMIEATHQRSPSFTSWKLLMPRAKGAPSCSRRDSYVLNTWAMLPNSSTRFATPVSKKPCFSNAGSARWIYLSASSVLYTACASAVWLTGISRHSGRSNDLNRFQSRGPGGPEMTSYTAAMMASIDRTSSARAFGRTVSGSTNAGAACAAAGAPGAACPDAGFAGPTDAADASTRTRAVRVRPMRVSVARKARIGGRRWAWAVGGAQAWFAAYVGSGFSRIGTASTVRITEVSRAVPSSPTRARPRGSRSR